MSPEIHALVLDLVAWVAAAPRDYDDVMDAWRTSCPRLTVWEDATEQGYVVHERQPEAAGTTVRVTEAGLRFLAENGRLPRAVARPDLAAAE